MIAVIITRAVPDHLRGYLGRFLTELVPGVFVGRTTSSVAERLWARTSEGLEAGAMALVLTDPSKEQGFSFRTSGTNPPTIVDMDGLQMVATQIPKASDLDHEPADTTTNRRLAAKNGAL